MILRIYLKQSHRNSAELKIQKDWNLVPSWSATPESAPSVPPKASKLQGQTTGTADGGTELLNTASESGGRFANLSDLSLPSKSMSQSDSISTELAYVKEDRMEVVCIKADLQKSRSKTFKTPLVHMKDNVKDTNENCTSKTTSMTGSISEKERVSHQRDRQGSLQMKTGKIHTCKQKETASSLQNISEGKMEVNLETEAAVMGAAGESTTITWEVCLTSEGIGGKECIHFSSKGRACRICPRTVRADLDQVSVFLSAKAPEWFDCDYTRESSMRHIRQAADFLPAFPATYFAHPGIFFTSPQERRRFEFFRLSTFAKLEDLHVSPVRLAESGFYYDEELDDIVCFSCRLSKRHWNEGEKKVAIVHLTLSNNCAQANFKDERNVPVKNQFPHIASLTTPEQPRENTNNKQRSDASNTTAWETTDARRSSHTQLSASALSSTVESHPQTSICNSVLSPLSAPNPTPANGARSKAGNSALQSSGRPEVNGNTSRRSPDTLPCQPTAATGNCRYPVQVDQPLSAGPNQSVPCGASGGDSRQTQGGHSRSDGLPDGDSEVSSLDTRRAVSPGNASVSARLASFVEWPARGLPSPRLLVIAGFYYLGSGDSVRCFYCGVTLRNWRQNDDPWETHVRFRFSCDYVTAIKGEYFVHETLIKLASGCSIASTPNGSLTESSTSASSEQPRLTSATTGTVPTPAENPAQGSPAVSSGATTGEASSSGRRQNIERSSAVVSSSGASSNAGGGSGPERISQQAIASGQPSAASPTTVSRQQSTASRTTVSSDQPAPRSTTRIGDNRDEVTYLQRLQEANRRLRQRHTCRLCGDRAVDIIFLPCGHLCTCESCAATIRECCLCHDRIRGTAHVYLD